MKRVLFVLLTFVLAAALLLPIAADYHNENYGRVNNYEGTITLDGVKDEAYTKYGRKFTADTWWGFGIDQRDHADFWWVFTDNYGVLRVFTEVHDAVLIEPPAEKQTNIDGCCHTDNVELWIDPTNNAAENSAELIREEAWHFRCDISNYTSATLWGAEYVGNAACDPFFKTKVQVTDYGYTIEWEIYTDAFQVPLQRGEKWGVNMMMNDVYDARHDADKPEHWNNPAYYFMASYLVVGPSDFGPSIQPMDFDYITLGNSVRPGETPPDPADDPELDENDPTRPASPQTADNMLLSAALLVLSAAGAAIVIKRRRK